MKTIFLVRGWERFLEFEARSFRGDLILLGSSSFFSPEGLQRFWDIRVVTFPLAPGKKFYLTSGTRFRSLLARIRKPESLLDYLKEVFEKWHDLPHPDLRTIFPLPTETFVPLRIRLDDHDMIVTRGHSDLDLDLVRSFQVLGEV